MAINWESRLSELGVDIRLGRGELLSPGVIRINANDAISEVRGKKIIIATGSQPASLPTLPFEDDVVISADDVFREYEHSKICVCFGWRGQWM